MLLVCLIWGTNFSVIKSAFPLMPPLAFTAVRFVISSALLWGLLRWREGPVVLPRGKRAALVALGILGNTLYQVAFTVGLAHTEATNSSLIISAVPTVVLAFGALLGIERPSGRMYAGVALATAGVALVVTAKGVAFERETLYGDFLSVLAMLCWAGYTLGVRRYLRGVSPLAVTALTTITGTPGLVLVGAPQVLRLDWHALTGAVWMALAYSSVLSLVVAYFIWNSSIQRVGSSRTAIYMCVTPLFAAASAWVILG
ncbi:MAG TPA: DMT family transporter, partial [Gemmatimonadales bacterium]|nr:DMT family transporter [Gemmatimonadales bacterium]